MSDVYQEKELKPYDAGTLLQGEGMPNLQTVDDWIRYMMTIRERFGNTVMVGKFHMQWGASALWAIDTLTQERDALREENARLRRYIGVMDAALKIPDVSSTTAERCKRTDSLIGSDDWMEEPACLCVVCTNHAPPPAGAGNAKEVGK